MSGNSRRDPGAPDRVALMRPSQNTEDSTPLALHAGAPGSQIERTVSSRWLSPAAFSTVPRRGGRSASPPPSAPPPPGPAAARGVLPPGRDAARDRLEQQHPDAARGRGEQLILDPRARTASGSSLSTYAAIAALPVFITGSRPASPGLAVPRRPSARYVQRASSTAHGCRSIPVRAGAPPADSAHAAPAAPVPQPMSRIADGGGSCAPSDSTTWRAARKWSGA